MLVKNTNYTSAKGISKLFSACICSLGISCLSRIEDKKWTEGHLAGRQQRIQKKVTEFTPVHSELLSEIICRFDASQRLAARTICQVCMPAWLRLENHADAYLLAVNRTLAGFFLKKTQAEGLGRPLAAFGAILVFSPIEGMAPDSDLPFHFDHKSCCIKSHLQVQSLCSGLWFSINCILPRHFDWVSALMVTLLDHYVLVF